MRADPHRDESGSMVLALLATIVASGLMLAVVSYAFHGQRLVRFDRDHSRVIQQADAGVNEVLYRLSLPASDPLRITAAFPVLAPPGPAPLTAPETLGDGTFRWRVDPVPPGQTAVWKVESYGTINGVQRHVRAMVEQPRPFRLAAFADSSMTLRGGNTVDSYTSGAWNTGNGTVGSNGNMTFNGAGVVADGVEVHDFEAKPGVQRCVSNGNTLCTTSKTNHDALKDLSSDAALGFITEGIEVGCTAANTWRTWTGTAIVRLDNTSFASTLGPGVHCFNEIAIGKNVIANVTGTATNPTIIYLLGASTPGGYSVAVGNGARVNCPTLSGGLCSPRPEASRLQIYTKALGDVRIGNHSHFAGIIYAPQASCRGNPSNAQAHYYGALVCSIITNQGGWRFHYDERLADVGAGGHDIIRWSED